MIESDPADVRGSFKQQGGSLRNLFRNLIYSRGSPSGDRNSVEPSEASKSQSTTHAIGPSSKSFRIHHDTQEGVTEDDQDGGDDDDPNEQILREITRRYEISKQSSSSPGLMGADVLAYSAARSPFSLMSLDAEKLSGLRNILSSTLEKPNLEQGRVEMIKRLHEIFDQTRSTGRITATRPSSPIRRLPARSSEPSLSIRSQQKRPLLSDASRSRSSQQSAYGTTVTSDDAANAGPTKASYDSNSLGEHSTTMPSSGILSMVDETAAVEETSQEQDSTDIEEDDAGSGSFKSLIDEIKNEVEAQKRQQAINDPINTQQPEESSEPIVEEGPAVATLRKPSSSTGFSKAAEIAVDEIDAEPISASATSATAAAGDACGRRTRHRDPAERRESPWRDDFRDRRRRSSTRRRRSRISSFERKTRSPSRPTKEEEMKNLLLAQALKDAERWEKHAKGAMSSLDSLQERYTQSLEKLRLLYADFREACETNARLEAEKTDLKRSRASDDQEFEKQRKTLLELQVEIETKTRECKNLQKKKIEETARMAAELCSKSVGDQLKGRFEDLCENVKAQHKQMEEKLNKWQIDFGDTTHKRLQEISDHSKRQLAQTMADDLSKLQKNLTAVFSEKTEGLKADVHKLHLSQKAFEDKMAQIVSFVRPIPESMAQILNENDKIRTDLGRSFRALDEQNLGTSKNFQTALETMSRDLTTQMEELKKEFLALKKARNMRKTIIKKVKMEKTKRRKDEKEGFIVAGQEDKLPKIHTLENRVIRKKGCLRTTSKRKPTLSSKENPVVEPIYMERKKRLQHTGRARSITSTPKMRQMIGMAQTQVNKNVRFSTSRNVVERGQSGFPASSEAKRLAYRPRRMHEVEFDKMVKCELALSDDAAVCLTTEQKLQLLASERKVLERELKTRWPEKIC